MTYEPGRDSRPRVEPNLDLVARQRHATRRAFLEWGLGAGGTLAVLPWLAACGTSRGAPGSANSLLGVSAEIAPLEASGDPLPGASRYGSWRVRDGLPEFVYAADQDSLSEAEWDPIDAPKTRRHFHLVGNRGLQMLVANDGTVGLFDESEGVRWLVYAGAEGGTGVSQIVEATGQPVWGSAFAQRPPGPAPQRVFGPTYFQVLAQHDGLSLERTLLCPEGDARWVLVRVRLTLSERARPRRVEHREIWRLRPRFLTVWQKDPVRDEQAAAVRYHISTRDRAVIAREDFSQASAAIGSEAELRLEALGETAATLSASEDPPNNPTRSPIEHRWPTLAARTEVALSSGESRTLWFRFGRTEGELAEAPEEVFARSMRSLRQRLPVARVERAPEAGHEIPWHVAALTGGASVDRVLGGHSLSQGSAYSFVVGANAAARDALQHALPWSTPSRISPCRCSRTPVPGALPTAICPSRCRATSPRSPTCCGRPTKICGRCGWPPSTPSPPATLRPSRRRCRFIPAVVLRRSRCESICCVSTGSSSTWWDVAAAAMCVSSTPIGTTRPSR